MKTITIIFLLAIGLMTPQILPAQGTATFVSNLAVPANGNASVGIDKWYAVGFRTGNSPGGYTFNSLQLAMATPTGSPTGFRAAFYNVTDIFPQSSVAELAGPAPETTGVYSYTASGAIFAPSTLYFVVITSLSPVATDAYNAIVANSLGYSSSDNWFMGFHFSSPDGLNWSRNGVPFQFAINATAVPEPSCLLALGLSGLILGARLLGVRGNVKR